MYKTKILFFFLTLCIPLYASNQVTDTSCFFKNIDGYFHTLFLYIPVDNKESIHKLFPNIPLSTYDIDYPSFNKFILTKDTRIFTNKSNATLIFHMIFMTWRDTIPKFMLIQLHHNKNNPYDVLKRYIAYLNDFVAHTNFSYNYNHYNNRKTQFVYVFYHGNHAWLSIPYMVGLNDKDLLHIRYLDDFCSTSSPKS